MNVCFLDPGFPSNQREFVRALVSVGARVHGIGDRPVEWLDGELRGWLASYRQVRSTVDEGEIERAVREAQGEVWIDRLETVIEAHVLPAAHVRERLGIPGTLSRTAWLCRDKPAMKQALRAAGVRTADSAGVSSEAEAIEFARQVGYPVIVKPRDAAGAAGTWRADDEGALRAAARESGLADGAPAAIEEFVDGHEGFHDTLCVEGEPGPRKVYGQRWLVETLMSVVKRKWGEALAARLPAMQERQALLRGLVYNLYRLVGLGVRPTLAGP